jgi:hypothetical protein
MSSAEPVAEYNVTFSGLTTFNRILIYWDPPHIPSSFKVELFKENGAKDIISKVVENTASTYTASFIHTYSHKIRIQMLKKGSLSVNYGIR